MKQKYFLITILAIVSVSFKSDNPAYLLYNSKGKQAEYNKMIEDLSKADIVFFGELHTDPIAHWLQLEITQDFFELKKQDLILGAEMFESDNQLLVNEYLADFYDDKKFEAEAKLWNNYKTDYKPVLDFAKANQLKYIATNIPRRYASIVHKKGFDGLKELSPEAKALISPDLERLYDKDVKCYAEMLNMAGMGGHVNENFPKAQAAKDATMAHFILKNWQKGKLFFHFDGAYHSDNYEGIVWWLKKLKPELNIKTISTVYQKNIQELEENNKNRADYIIAVPENMTQTNR
jgi:uncharacterized iron-regulated protein